SAQIREILISESAWEEMTCLFAPSLDNPLRLLHYLLNHLSYQIFVTSPFRWKHYLLFVQGRKLQRS
ncbi:hypothetical protein ACPEMX_28065, partial [Klebsiella quasipneumoniae]